LLFKQNFAKFYFYITSKYLLKPSVKYITKICSVTLNNLITNDHCSHNSTRKCYAVSCSAVSPVSSSSSTQLLVQVSLANPTWKK